MAEESSEAEDGATPSRRGLLTSLAIVGGGLVVGGGVGKVLMGSAPATAQPKPKTAKEIEEALRAGNDRFVAGAPQHPNGGPEARAQTADKQTPFAAVLACADSRVPPDLVYDQGIGDLFVVRVAGNIATEDVVASLAYAVEHLGVRYIVVMGHQGCGAVKATLEAIKAKAVPEPFAVLVEALRPAVETAMGEERDEGAILTRAVAENAKAVARSLTRTSDILAEAYGKDELTVQAVVYDLRSGAVSPAR